MAPICELLFGMFHFLSHDYRRSLGILILVLGQIVLSDSGASASIVNWSGETLAGKGTSTISTAGTLVEAHNAGSSATTVGGVAFDGVTPNPFGRTFGGANPQQITGDSGFDSMLTTISWDYGVETISFNNLTVGNSYQIQMFVVDSRSGSIGARTVTVDDGNGNALTSQALRLGYVFNGSFTAMSTSQFVDVSGSSVPYISAWQLRETVSNPEPTTLLLFGCALYPLIAKRRRV